MNIKGMIGQIDSIKIECKINQWIPDGTAYLINNNAIMLDELSILPNNSHAKYTCIAKTKVDLEKAIKIILDEANGE